MSDVKTRVSAAASGEVAIPLAQASKIQDRHHDRLAVIYVRQSSPHQVIDHPESTARQYALVGRAVALGWERDRILVIDDDLGQSARSVEGRKGFQRMRELVLLKHVGLVLSLEVSRVARSSRDWYDLFECCGVNDILLSDEDGVYDANDVNDRLILGLKGIMSEMELSLMRGRLERGRRNKARRGELFQQVPRGYVRIPNGVDKDPDEEVRAIVTLVFDKFAEHKVAYAAARDLARQGIRLPTRQTEDGSVAWRSVTTSAILVMLHHPMYAGAYAHGRRKGVPSTAPPHEKWEVLIVDHLPAYISWTQYLENQRILAENRTDPSTRGASREGAALLCGMLYCACDRKMCVRYNTSQGYYVCSQQPLSGTDSSCCGGLAAPAIDELVARQVLRALEPASLELSLQAVQDIEAERSRQKDHFQQRLERTAYQCRLAERRCLQVEPENRLVARSLEQRWEVALREQRDLQEEYERFLQSTPQELTVADKVRIEYLSHVESLWNANGISAKDRQEIIRCVVDRVIVDVGDKSDHVDVTIEWAGGYQSQHELLRPVLAYRQLRDIELLVERVVELRAAGVSAPRIAKHLNEEGFTPPKRRGPFNESQVRKLFERGGPAYGLLKHRELAANEWATMDLATHLGIREKKLKYWVRQGWLRAIQRPLGGRWIVWADKEELGRLEQLASKSRHGISKYPSELITPKSMSDPSSDTK